MWRFIFSMLICVPEALTQKELLMKFHQRDYKVRNVRLDVESVNHSYFEVFNVISFKHNRTVTAINCTLHSKIDMDSKLQVVAQAFKWASNEYRIFPMRMQYNLCLAFRMNVLGSRKLAELGNLNLCNIKKGILYKFTNYVIDDAHLPPFVPHGEYKITNTLVCGQDKVEAAMYNSYGEVYRRFGNK